jgi:hypothetical protein
MKTHRANGTRLTDSDMAFARYRAERERLRDRVLVEFAENPQAIADEVIYLRGAIGSIGEAARWMQIRAPFTLLGPGPRSQARKSERNNDERRCRTSGKPRPMSDGGMAESC